MTCSPLNEDVADWNLLASKIQGNLREKWKKEKNSFDDDNDDKLKCRDRLLLSFFVEFYFTQDIIVRQ